MTVSGTVRTNQDPPAAIEGAVVRATNLDTSQVDGETTTDASGAYTISDLRGDRYTIEVTPPSGYLPVPPKQVSRPATGSLELRVDFALPAPTPPPTAPLTVSGTVRWSQDPASGVEGAVVRATNLDTGQVDGEATTDRSGAYAIGDLPGDRYAIEITPPPGYRGAAPEHVSRPATGSLELRVDFALPVDTPLAGAVTAVPATGLIAKTANFFDLEGRTVTFTPDGEGRYAVETGSLTWVATGAATSRVVNFAPVVDPHHHFHGFGRTWAEASSTGKSTVVRLPFGFPFAGRVVDTRPCQPERQRLVRITREHTLGAERPLVQRNDAVRRGGGGFPFSGGAGGDDRGAVGSLRRDRRLRRHLASDKW